MKLLYNFIISLLIALSLSHCIEPFSPPETNSGQGHLVVDGFLNTGNDTSYISLRLTQNIYDQPSQFLIQNAAMMISTEQGNETYQFTYKGNGEYFLPPQNFSHQNKYRLTIHLDGEVYESEYVEVSDTPEIDSITYRVDNNLNSVVINVNTHDELNKTRFYRWRFEETHEYFATYYSSLIADSETNIIIPRTQNINRCWKTDLNKNILLGSTIKQSQDAILSLPVNNVPIETNKFLVKYSILVKQYGLTREAFEYWTTLTKTTQGTGSLFDPLPSLVTGNIKNIGNKDKLVFGYFSAGKETQKRIFINEGLGQYPRCLPPDTLSRFEEAVFYPGILLLNYFGEREDSLLVTTYDCADCRIKGGTIIKPSYWQ